MVHNKGNEIFLKVDCVEPVYDGGYSISGDSCLNGIKVWIGNNGHFFPCDRYTVCDPDVVREDGHQQAFALTRKIWSMNVSERREAFGKTLFGEVLKDTSYDDLAKKLDDWKKEKEEIHVKDEVEHTEFGYKAVVIGIQKDEYGHDHILAIGKNKLFIADMPASDFKKTGVHIDDLDAYLEV